MYCTQCGKQNPDGARFCKFCGHPLPAAPSPAPAPARPQASAPMPAMPPAPAPSSNRPKPNANKKTAIAVVVGVACAIAICALVFGVAGRPSHKNASSGSAGSTSVTAPSGSTITASARPLFIAPLSATDAAYAAPALAGYTDKNVLEQNASQNAQQAGAATTSLSSTTKRGDDPSSTSNPYGSTSTYTVDSDLSNVTNLNDVFVPQSVQPLLAQNDFAVLEGAGGNEFFDVYEFNRYNLYPSFVTTDSILHTYHLYFSHLLKNTEKTSLSPTVSSMSTALYQESQNQLGALAGTEWESAAQRNVGYFAVACRLTGQDVSVPDYVSAAVDAEVVNITSASGIATSSLTGVDIDYSQFAPRGYYEGDPQLEQYFRAMQWFGQVNFTQTDEDLDRSALLMTLAVNDVLDQWSSVYAVTGFFAGQSDDCGYYEYYPIAQACYGSDVSASSLAGNDSAWKSYHSLTAQMEAPQVSSAVVTGSDANDTAAEKGFRLMGQRFTLDEGIFTQLTAPQVSDRIMPDPLDVPVTLGSAEAQSILDSEGKTSFPGYSDNVAQLRRDIANNGSTIWTESLYSQWLYTLNPLLVSKREGYPSFMQSPAWDRKNLQTYLSSYTELKHDTVLYTKQAMVEMGGEIDPVDDRGYVEPEPVVYERLANLTRATSAGLSGYGMLASDDAADLELLAQLCDQLQTISQKELAGDALTSDEYELIRSYGGQLEHFWTQAYNGEVGKGTMRSMTHPAALVTDIASNSDTGTCLEVATGKVSTMYVVFPIDGELHVGIGAVSSYYQFEQPMANRLTDSQWRTMLGISADALGTASVPDAPEWTSTFQMRER